MVGACSASFAPTLSGTFGGGSGSGGSPVGGGSSSSGGGGGGDGGGATGMAIDGGGIGASCDPAVAGGCAAGLTCDSSRSTCRLPADGEACEPGVGCGPAPAGLECVAASWSGNQRTLCLVPCDGADSAPCPYLTSCGDPDLPGYCSPAGQSACTPWLPCALGPHLAGSCLPGNGGDVCAAIGTVVTPYGRCDPLASNRDGSLLCAAGMLCLPDPSGLSAEGECVPLCDADGGPSCVSDEHCSSASGWPFGLCLAGPPCEIGGRGCFAGATCLPDDLDAPYGGCATSAPDAGTRGASCTPIHGSGQNPCAPGLACLPGSDGGSDCEPPCLLGAPDLGASCQCVPLAGEPDASIGNCQ